MKVAILQCDEVLEKFQSQFGDYSGMIQHMFDVLDDTLEFEIFNVQQGMYPQDIDIYDFYITTGSKVGVYEDIPWIQEFIEYVRLLDRKKKKLIGICFGHQIIAEAFGYPVEKTEKGWGIGVAVNRIVATPGWMSTHKADLNIIVSHQDQVISLPKEALVIAESDFCPYFMVQWNRHFLSIQGHPEFSADYSRAMMNERKAIIPAQRIEAGLESLSIEPDNALFTHWIMDFVKH